MLASLLLLVSPQTDERPTMQIERLEISRSSSFPSVELDILTTYPNTSMLTIEMAPCHYMFHFYDDAFTWFSSEDYSQNFKAVEIPSDGRCRNVRLSALGPGIYDLRVRFEIARQPFPDRMRSRLGAFFHDALLDQRTLAIGIDDRVTGDLLVDTRECRKLLAAGSRAVERMARIAEGAEKEWEQQVLAEMEKLGKVHAEAMKRRQSTLLQGTYELLDQIAANILMSHDLIEAFYYERKRREKQGKPLDDLSIETYSMGGDLDAVTHPPDPDEKGPPPDHTGRGRINYRRMVAQLEKCKSVYRREATIWSLRFIDLLLADLASLEARVRAGAPFAEQTAEVAEVARTMSRIREMVGTLRKEDDYTAEWKLEDEKNNFAAAVARLDGYQKALLENLADEKVPPETPEDLVTQRRDLEKALKEWMTRVRGTDKD